MKTTASPAAWRGPVAAFGLQLTTGAGGWSLDAWLHERPWRLGVRRAWLHKTTLATSIALLLIGLGTWPAAAGCAFGHLYSDLTIEPGKKFLLGGTQRGAFKVVAKNKGTVAVEVREQLRGGGTIAKVLLKPGQQGVLRFADGSTAVLLNSSATNARLDLTVTGDNGNLRMTTEPVRATGKATTKPRLSGGELSDALANWKGTFTYLNHGTQETVALTTTLQGVMTQPNQLLLRFDYEEPNKKHVFGTDTLLLAADGTHLRWDGVEYTVQAKQWLPGQTLSVVLEGQGRDDNRAATIRKTLTLSPQQLVVKKEVRYATGTPFLQRHQYRFTR